jgi:hypothetical protein
VTDVPGGPSSPRVARHLPAPTPVGIERREFIGRQ